MESATISKENGNTHKQMQAVSHKCVTIHHTCATPLTWFMLNSTYSFYSMFITLIGNGIFVRFSIIKYQFHHGISMYFVQLTRMLLLYFFSIHEHTFILSIHIFNSNQFRVFRSICVFISNISSVHFSSSLGSVHLLPQNLPNVF